MSQIDKSSQQQLKLIRGKRKALEQLIKFAKQVCEQGSAMQDVIQLSKPSQSIAKSFHHYVSTLSEKVKKLPTTELERQLEKLDALIKKQVAKLFSLSSVDTTKLSEQKLELEIKRIKGLLEGFKTRTQLAVALRLVLHERGAITQRLELSVPQEVLNQKVEQLKQQETQVRTHIQQQVEEILQDIKVMRQSEALPDSMKDQLKTVHQVMLKNLTHIQQGKQLEDMPIDFEIITMGGEASFEPEPDLQENTFDVAEPDKKKSVKPKPEHLKSEPEKSDPATKTEGSPKPSSEPPNDPLASVSKKLDIDEQQKPSWWQRLLSIFKS